jgi:hypothetical protein
LLTQAQDILPTLVELLGLNIPANTTFDGMSLTAWLRGTTNVTSNRMFVTQFTRMNDSKPKRGDGAVLWKKWRLVADAELYDIATDPAQARNVISEFPDIATRMREHYARWWAGVEPRVNDISAVHIGSSKENSTLLTPCEWVDVFFDQQAQVRRGLKKNGVWTLFIERDGDYEFELRRWPAEADAPITAAMPAFRGVDGVFPPGEALPVASAELKIGELRQTKTIATADKAATFRLRLQRGRTELQTWFRNAADAEIAGAYYVYVRGPE